MHVHGQLRKMTAADHELQQLWAEFDAAFKALDKGRRRPGLLRRLWRSLW